MASTQPTLAKHHKDLAEKDAASDLQNSHFMNMSHIDFFVSKPNEEYENASLLLKIINADDESLFKLLAERSVASVR